jgi:methyl-accepting chemotaxis protein
MKIFTSIKAKTVAVLLTFMAVALAMFFFTIQVTHSQKTDSLVVNVVGRQRMLIQKMTKETLVFISSHSEKIKKASIQKTIDLFEMSLNALLDGGKTYSDLGMTQTVVLPPAVSKEIKNQLSRVKEQWTAFRKTLESVLESNGGSKEDVGKIIDSNLEILENMHRATSMMQNLSEAKVNRLITIQLIGLILLTITAIFYLLVIVKNLVQPVSRMAVIFKHVADGDLREHAEVKGNDEISRLGRSFNHVVENLSKIIKKVQNSTHEVEISTNEITTGSDDLAIRTNEEAASVTETSTTLEELTATVAQSRENSENTGNTLMEFNKEILSRVELISDVTGTMTEIHESGKKISDIVRVINDISFQTNLLALNAAVEAARAGEAGRGFAVVAAEVRNLAQKTAESSKNIQDIVNHNVDSTERGMKLINQTAEFFSTVVSKMETIVQNISQITDSSKEQAAGVEQINEAVFQLEKVINQNAALVEELSATARTMKTNSQDLRQLVDGFQIGQESVSRKTKPAVPEKKPQALSQPQSGPASRPPVSGAPAAKASPAPAKSVSTAAGEVEDDFFAVDGEEFEEF